MSGLLPIIEQLADARTDQERADWLLRCPLQILGKYEMTIRNRLMHAGFLAGTEYLEAELVGLRAVRGPDGQTIGSPAETITFIRFAMRRIADRQQPEEKS